MIGMKWKEVIKSNKRILISILLFALLSIVMFILYVLFRNINNQICNEILLMPMEDSVLNRNDEMSKVLLYYDLGMIAKYISLGALIVTGLLSGATIYKFLKETRIYHKRSNTNE